ncbi:MAG TPA: DUF4160 domain-containing protein [Candidatus Polarisedimenticolia bacterium]|nr:DUF4160 domain-containing protein [Candidatus Polarisedimenticolia bacterium]
MPEICRFFGIIITMYYNDHVPPHFHARYGGERASIGIESLQVLDGSLSPRALGLVMEWASVHRRELMIDWLLAQSRSPLKPIDPLR